MQKFDLVFVLDRILNAYQGAALFENLNERREHFLKIDKLLDLGEQLRVALRRCSL